MSTDASAATSLVSTPAPPSRAAIHGGLLVIALANVADLLSSIEAFAKFTLTMFGLSVAPLLVTATLIFCVAGYVILYGGLYRRFVSHLTGLRRWTFAAVLMALVASTFFINFSAWAGPNAEALATEQLHQWKQAILEAQHESGGINTFPHAVAKPQAWTTAQALTALLTDPELSRSSKAEIRDAFAYLEAQRLDHAGGGWGYWEESTWAVTEISGWVVVAYARSLSVPGIWDANERSEIAQRIEREIEWLSDRQTEDGGWGPVRLQSEDGVRTYSTVMALWAFVEAGRVDLLATRLSSKKHVLRLQRAFRWLTANYDEKYGWFPNPGRGEQHEAFPGLSAQTLWVLYQVATIKPVLNGLVRNPTFMQAKAQLLENDALWTRPVGQSERLSSADQHLRSSVAEGSESCACDFLIEGSTFLWYPWTFAALDLLAQDSTLKASNKRVAERQKARLAARFQELVHHLQKGGVETYESAEAIITLAPTLAPRSAREG
jgi:hypothetical protein